MYYVTLGNATSGGSAPMVVDLRAATMAPLDPAAAEALGATGPLCFDDSLGLLVAAGGPNGGLVGWSPASGAATTLRTAGLGGIVGVRSFDCSDGVVAAGVVCYEEEGSPTRMVAFDFSAGGSSIEGGQPFYNSTSPVELHDLVLTTGQSAR